MDLAFGSAPTLPQWWSDETVFSWASRYHQLAGHRLAAQTCLALFGDRRQGAQHDLPNRLASLADAAAGNLGTPQSIALDHTLLRYYLIARTPDESAAAVTSLVHPTPGVLKFRLGILTSRFRANHPLKACPRCMDDDVSAWGSSYWHLAHQYPGAWICRQHDTPLLRSTVKTNGISRFKWMLPPKAVLVDVVPSASSAALRQFADFVAGWSSLAPASLTASGIAAACRAQLRQGDGGLELSSRADAASAFAKAIAPLRQVPELQGLPATDALAKGDLDRWVFAPRGGTHPLRHLAIIYWLFSSWDGFLAAYAEAQTDDRAAEPLATAGGPIDPRRVPFVQALQAGRSVTAASKLVGVTVSTGLAWATQHGIKTPRRPKSMTDAIHARIVEELGRGDEKADIARRHDVSVQAVTRVLRSEVGLADTRRLAQGVRAQAAARQAWSAALAAWPGATVADLRTRAGAAYAWLRRHDGQWLDANLPARQRLPLAPRVDWDSRDVRLAEEVRRVAAELTADNAGKRLHPWQIYQALPELKAKQSALVRLPLTTRALAEVTRPPRRSKQQNLL